MRKLILCSVLIPLCLSLWGCGKAEDTEANTVIIEKSGKITSVIYEDFSQDYYGEDDIKSFILNEVAEYNKNKPEAVTVTKIESVDDNIRVVMEYKTSEDYAAFNKRTFFFGTVKEAYDAGINLEVTLLDISDEGNEVDRAALLEMGERKIIVFDEAIHVRTYNKIDFASEDLMIVRGDKEAVSMIADMEYIVLK